MAFPSEYKLQNAAPEGEIVKFYSWEDFLIDNLKFDVLAPMVKVFNYVLSDSSKSHAGAHYFVIIGWKESKRNFK